MSVYISFTKIPPAQLHKAYIWLFDAVWYTNKFLEIIHKLISFDKCCTFPVLGRCSNDMSSIEISYLVHYYSVHYDGVIMSTIASQITSLTIVYSTIYSGADQSKHQSSASLAFVWGIHRGRVNSANKWPVTRKMFPFDDVIMISQINSYVSHPLNRATSTDGYFLVPEAYGLIT